MDFLKEIILQLIVVFFHTCILDYERLSFPTTCLAIPIYVWVHIPVSVHPSGTEVHKDHFKGCSKEEED